MVSWEVGVSVNLHYNVCVKKKQKRNDLYSGPWCIMDFNKLQSFSERLRHRGQTDKSKE